MLSEEHFERCSLENANMLVDRYEDELLFIDSWDDDSISVTSLEGDSIMVDNARDSDRYVPVKVDSLSEME